MDNLIRVSCCISTTDAAVPLGIEIWLDDQCIFDQPWVRETIEWSYSMLDDDAEHELRWVLKNKTQDHTKIDLRGNILQDSRLILKDISIIDIPLGYIVTQNSRYRHDHNGTTELADHPFYGEMGCNGSVSLKFSTPIYLWLLEHL